MPNIVKLKEVGKLLTGYEHFYIPSYQRGYRWRRKQVEDLLADLYSFIKRPKVNAGDNMNSPFGDFYCLQPLIVKPIPVGDPRRDKALPAGIASDPKHHLWELVDGQQRLTTIYLLLKTFLKKQSREILDDYEMEYYSIYYESRPNFLEDLDNEEAEQNIDLLHARKVCEVASMWTSKAQSGKGIELSKLYEGGSGEKGLKIIDALVNLLMADTDKDVVKFIWYQLDTDANTDTVREFIRINNGKIPLLDSELVKALFLQRRFDHLGKITDVSTQRAMEWENIENRLNASDFWGFISPDGNNTEDRMGYLLEIIYRANLKKSNTLDDHTVLKIEKGDIFRYFYNAFEGKKNVVLQAALDERWSQIVDTFHAMEDWYESPLRFNYIGFLIQAGTDASVIYTAFCDAVDDTLKNNGGNVISFDEWLKEQIRLKLFNVEVVLVDVEKPNDSPIEEYLAPPKKPRILTQYGGNGSRTIRNIFRMLNIELLTSQFREIAEEPDKKDIHDSGVFRFPFDLYKENGWDIEHIDSQTENPLKSNEDQVRWIVGAILDTNDKLSDEDRKKLGDNVLQVEDNRDAKPSWEFLTGKLNDDLLDELNKGSWRTAVSLIQEEAGVEKHNEHFIGNLTLLDSETNRSYKNALFCTKRKEIIKAMGSGRYILPATQYAFMKFFDSDTISATSRIKWSNDDKEKHHDFIYNQLKDFLPDAK